MRAQDLSSAAWTVRAVGDLGTVPARLRGTVAPARVPGCVHTDLMRAELIGDPRVGFNERDLLWIGETDWEYRLRFHGEPVLFEEERVDLVCDGLDTIAEVSLNGRPVGNAANMFHPHRFDVRSALKAGENELSIVFRSPLGHIRAEERRLGKRPVNGDWDPYIFIRKAACNFGWDWAPKVATCGVWRPIRIEAWSGVRLGDVAVVGQSVEDRWTLVLSAQCEWSVEAGDRPRSLYARLTGGKAAVSGCCPMPVGSCRVPITLGPFEAALWWPRGHGEQPLYDVDLRIIDGTPEQARLYDHAWRLGREAFELSGAPAWEESAVWRRRVAFRTVTLNTDADEHGDKFQIEINGTPIFCKGANWVPEGLFPDDRQPEKIRERVRQAADAGMNMLRVWGGGLYESDAFYEECDRLGIMVWQDFMFACACYPEEAPYPELVEREARHQIARLSAHPSVVMWCGGNECVWGYESWGHAATDVEGPWKKRVGDKTWGAGYWYDLLPRLMRELDPTRPYWPNSPFAGVVGENPNQETRGDRHTWDASPGSRAFRAIVPRFCAEFGHQAPANVETLLTVMTPDDLVVGGPALQHRQRGTGGMERHIDEPLRAALAHHPGLAARHDASTFEGWHTLAQMAQAGSLQAAIEHLAASRPRCMGALVWQLNDAWPGMSWSLIDSDGRPKPAYFAVKDAFGAIP